MWFWIVWNVERIGRGTVWVRMLNPCIPHWKTYNKEERNERSVSVACLLGIIHRDSIAQRHTDYWFNEVAVALQGGIETVVLN